MTAADFMQLMSNNLWRHEQETGKPASYRAVADELRVIELHPRWREEAPDSGTTEEYFIRMARAFGLHASPDPMSGGLFFRRTTGVIDEAKITWPGKR